MLGSTGFRAPLCPSSGAHDGSAGYHIGRLVLELLLVGSSVQAGQMSVRTDTHPPCLHLTLQSAATREPDDQCGNQRYRRELLMTGIMVPETC